MIFGNIEKFAIKIDVNNEVLPTGLQPCHFCYLIGGIEVGNFDFEAPEHEIYLELLNFSRHVGKRNSSALFHCSSKTSVAKIREGLLESNDLYRQYVVSYYMGHGYPIDEGKRWEVYIIEHRSSARILFTERNSFQSISEVKLEAGEFDTVIAECLDLLERRLH